uniref:DUF2052 domain-containing protein n=1 Tax=Caenorhabditis tropicalis TaxID=1561998 RepID=A0A1I7TE79_9PELO
MRLFKTDLIKGSELKRYETPEKSPDSVKERPIREGVIYQMKMNNDFEAEYLKFRKKRFLEEMSNGLMSQYRYYDKLELPDEYDDIEYIYEQIPPNLNVMRLNKDPEFVEETVAIEWEIATPRLVMAAEEAKFAAMEAELKEKKYKGKNKQGVKLSKVMDKTRKPRE